MKAPAIETIGIVDGSLTPESRTSGSPTCLPSSTDFIAPPRYPYPWMWQCHHCGSGYRLACTRRCLSCGHIFCPALIQERASSRNAPLGKKGVTCTAEFDYSGWAVWGAYRRFVCGMTSDCNNSESARKRKRDWNEPEVYAPWDASNLGDARLEQMAHRKKIMYLEGTYNCWPHCDFPSECLRTRHAAWVRSQDWAVGDHQDEFLSQVDGGGGGQEIDASMHAQFNLGTQRQTQQQQQQQQQQHLLGDEQITSEEFLEESTCSSAESAESSNLSDEDYYEGSGSGSDLDSDTT